MQYTIAYFLYKQVWQDAHFFDILIKEMPNLAFSSH